jgi:hypothetical protein
MSGAGKKLKCFYSNTSVAYLTTLNQAINMGIITTFDMDKAVGLTIDGKLCSFDFQRGQNYTDNFLQTIKRCAECHDPEKRKIKLNFKGRMTPPSMEFTTFEDMQSWIIKFVIGWMFQITYGDAAPERIGAFAVATLIKEEFKRVWQYVDLCKIESNYKHSCAASDLIWTGLNDTPYSWGCEKLAGRTSVEDKSRAIGEDYEAMRAFVGTA